jgi:hypothetical protein
MLLFLKGYNSFPGFSAKWIYFIFCRVFLDFPPSFAEFTSFSAGVFWISPVFYRISFIFCKQFSEFPPFSAGSFASFGQIMPVGRCRIDRLTLDGMMTQCGGGSGLRPVDDASNSAKLRMSID